MFNRLFSKRERIKDIPDNTGVADGFYYWFNKLLDVCINMFTYEGLPDTLPAKELETCLLLQEDGHATVFYTPRHGVVCAWSTLYGYDLYYKPTHATYAQPVLGSGNLEIGKDCEIIYNNSLEAGYYTYTADSGLNSFISRYARALADIDSTISIYTINKRASEFPIAKNEKTRQSLIRFYQKLKEGTTDIIVDDFIMEAFKAIERGQQTSADKLNDLLLAKDKILEQFFRDLGIRFYNPKKAQVNEEEIEATTQLLVINTDDMLKARQEGIARVNKHFGLNISVRLNDKFDISNYVEKSVDNVDNGGVNYEG